MLVECFSDDIEAKGLRLRDATGKTLVFHETYRLALEIPHEQRSDGSYADSGVPLLDVVQDAFDRLYGSIMGYGILRSLDPDFEGSDDAEGLKTDAQMLERMILCGVRDQVQEGCHEYVVGLMTVLCMDYISSSSLTGHQNQTPPFYDDGYTAGSRDRS